MNKKPLKNIGQSTLEYVVMIMFLIGVVVAMRTYLERGIQGRWKSVGDSMGHGRLYDPGQTEECAQHPLVPGTWYSVSCFEANCLSDCLPKYDDPTWKGACQACIGGCGGCG